MHPNEQLLHTFYSAFQNRDYKTMQQCYADNATFSDAVFKNLNAAQVKAMWEMLCKNAKNFSLEYKNISADDTTGQAEWIAHYTFSATGNKVTNRIKAAFTFRNGKIATHTDSFGFYTWARQALGTTGLLLGWTPFIKNKVQNTAQKNLTAFMEKQ